MNSHYYLKLSNSWLTVGICQLTVGHLLADCWLSFGRLLVIYLFIYLFNPDKLWNTLPVSTHTVSSLNQFKSLFVG